MSTSDVLQGNTLYLALLWRGDAHSWHYGLYLPDPAYAEQPADLLERGTFFHCMNLNATNEWTYEAITLPDARLGFSRRLVYAVRLGDMDALGPYADVIEAMTETLADVYVDAHASKEVFNCVTWAFAALACLDENGFIDCPGQERTKSVTYLARVMEATRKYDEGRGTYTVTAWEKCNI